MNSECQDQKHQWEMTLQLSGLIVKLKFGLLKLNSNTIYSPTVHGEGILQLYIFIWVACVGVCSNERDELHYGYLSKHVFIDKTMVAILVDYVQRHVHNIYNKLYYQGRYSFVTDF